MSAVTMGARRFGDARESDRLVDGALNHGFMEVVTPALPRLGMNVAPGGGEDSLPTPLARHARVLPGESIGKLNVAGTGTEVPAVLVSHEAEVIM